MKRLSQSFVNGIVGFTAFAICKHIVDGADDESALKNTVVDLVPTVLMLGILVVMFGWLLGGIGVYQYLKWNAFGNRLKVAYEGKFGYCNSAFDEEIDSLVTAMESLGNGQTKKLRMERFKELARFVEVPWAIPTEDRLSEKEKVNLFAGIDSRVG